MEKYSVQKASRLSTREGILLRFRNKATLKFCLLYLSYHRAAFQKEDEQQSESIMEQSKLCLISSGIAGKEYLRATVKLSAKIGLPGMYNYGIIVYIFL